jgi:hypothetical protein
MATSYTDQFDQLLATFDRDLILSYSQSKIKEAYRAITRKVVMVLLVIMIALLIIVFFIQVRTSMRIDESLFENILNIKPLPVEKNPPASKPNSDISELENEPLLTETLPADTAEGAGQFGEFAEIFTDDFDDLDALENAEAAFTGESEMPPDETDGLPQIPEPPLIKAAVNTILEKDGKLLRHESEGDFFVMLSPWEGLLNTVIGNGSFFVASKYDVHLRLVSRTEWQKRQDAADTQTVRQAIYFYADNAAQTARRREVYSFADKTLEKTEYDFDGLPLRVTIVKQAEKSGAGAKKEETVSETLFKYDGQRRVTEKKIRSFSSDADDQTETTRYTYTANAKTPNTYLYYGDTLRYSVVYDTDGNYTETRVLNEIYSVVSRYNNYELVREIYLLNGKEFRRREY